MKPDLSDASMTDDDRQKRRSQMAICAHAEIAELAQGLAAAGFGPHSAHDVRPPEVGLVMVRGRQGGTGDAFNLGEATVTRAAVQSEAGHVGIAYVLGRCPERARLTAIADALWQDTRTRQAVTQHILEPVAARLEAERATRRGETAATAVDFYTMVRGDD